MSLLRSLAVAVLVLLITSVIIFIAFVMNLCKGAKAADENPNRKPPDE